MITGTIKIKERKGEVYFTIKDIIYSHATEKEKEMFMEDLLENADKAEFFTDEDGQLLFDLGGDACGNDLDCC